MYSSLSVDIINVSFVVPQPSVIISQSVDSPNVGQNHILTCTVTVPSGVSSSLVQVNWSGGASLSDSPRVAISGVTNNGLCRVMFGFHFFLFR